MKRFKGGPWTWIILLLVTVIGAASQEKIQNFPKIELLLVDNTNGRQDENTKLFTINPHNNNHHHQDFVLDESKFRNKIKNKMTSEINIRLLCSDSFPVELDYTGQGVPIGVIENKRETSSFEGISNVDQLNLTFSVSFQFSFLLEQNTGLYSCCSSQWNEKTFKNEENHQCSSVYLFMGGESKFILASHSKMDGGFGIYSQTSLNKLEASSDQNSNKTDKKEEFQQNFSILKPHRRPYYHVIVVENEEEFVNFPCATSTPFINVSLFLEDENILLSSKLDPVVVHGQFDPKTGVKIHVKELTNNYYYRCTDGESSLYFQVQKKKKPDGQLTIRHAANESTFACHTTRESLISYGIVHCNSPIDCKFASSRIRNMVKPPMKLLRANSEIKLQYNLNPLPFGEKNIGRLRSYELLSTGIFYCSADNTEYKYITFIVDYRNSETYVLIDTVDTQWKSDLGEGSMSEQFLTLTQSLDDPELFNCFGNTAFTSSGIIWAIETHDGNLEFFPGEKELIDYEHGYINSQFSIHVVSHINQIKALRCYAPVLNSPREWSMAVSTDSFERNDNFIHVRMVVVKTVGFNLIFLVIYGVLVILSIKGYYHKRGILVKVCAMQGVIMLGFYLLNISY